jgi:hypothetical protein
VTIRTLEPEDSPERREPALDGTVAGRVPSRPSWTTSSWSPTTPSWPSRRQSSPGCGCLPATPVWSSNRPAALGIAAVLEDRVPFRLHVVTIVCASNVDVDAYHRRVGAAPPTGRPDNCSSGSRETGFTRVSSTGHSPRRPATMAMRRRLAKRTATLRDQVGVGNGSN